jgi:hypothetical protein
MMLLLLLHFTTHSLSQLSLAMIMALSLSGTLKTGANLLNLAMHMEKATSSQQLPLIQRSEDLFQPDQTVL